MSKIESIENLVGWNNILSNTPVGPYMTSSTLHSMKHQTSDKSSEEYQRLTWEMLKRSVQLHINKLNSSNILDTANKLFLENIVRGRGFLAKTLIQVQASAPDLTAIYAAFVAVINSKFPNIGKLVLTRLMVRLLKGLRRKDKQTSISSSLFIAHLVNQQVVHTLLALDIIDRVIESDNDSVEILINFMKGCGNKINQTSKAVVDHVFVALEQVHSKGKLDKRMQFMLEDTTHTYKNGFQEPVQKELDVVDATQQYTHKLMLNQVESNSTIVQDHLDVFKYDPNYLDNEKSYNERAKEILEDEKVPTECTDEYCDMVKTKLSSYLRSSLTPTECVYNLLNIKSSMESKLARVIVSFCAEMETYDRFLGQIAQELIKIKRVYSTYFQNIFKNSFENAQKLDQSSIEKISHFFAHLLKTEAVSWEMLKWIKINQDMPRSGLVFLKTLFDELINDVGFVQLNYKLKNTVLKEFLFKDVKCATNVFSMIGLQRLVADLIE